MFNNKKMQSGFTLIELMIVVGIIAILAAIAYPTYQNYIIRSHIEAARGKMMDNIRMMEEHYSKQRTMCAETNNVGVCTSMPQAINSSPDSKPDDKRDTYKITILPDTFNGGRGNSYIIAAEPNENAKFSENTINNKEVNLLYFSNGSGFVKCTKAGFNTAKNATANSNSDGSGCRIM